MTPRDMHDSQNTATALSHLNRLAESIDDPYYSKVVSGDSGRPFLRVISLKAPQLAETIMASPTEGEWWFWWSWAERISPVTEPENAAYQILKVLTPVSNEV